MSSWFSVGIGPVRFGKTIKGPSQTSSSSSMGCGGAVGTALVGLVILPFLVPWQTTAAVYGTIAGIALVFGAIAFAMYLKTKRYLHQIELERERKKRETEEREIQRQLEAATRTQEREDQQRVEAAAQRQAREDQLQLKKEASAANKKKRAEQRRAWAESGRNAVSRLSPKSDKPDSEPQPDTTQSTDTRIVKALRVTLRRDRSESPTE